MHETIRNVIFDLGNVLLDLDSDQVNVAFKNLLGEDFSRLAASEETKKIFLYLETGHYSEESFINALQRLSTTVPDGKKVIDAWNSLLVGIPSQRLDMLEALSKKGYQLYLLSNTNSLHIHWLHRYMKATHNIENFETQFFKKSYYSHLLGMRKPDKEIYEYVLSDAFIKAEETLFIDDGEANILGAQQLGISTLLHDPASDITELIQTFL